MLETATEAATWTGTREAKRRTGLSAAVKKVWLDGGIKPALDRPDAWQVGATGKGGPGLRTLWAMK
jgi:hypothetical protein